MTTQTNTPRVTRGHSNTHPDYSTQCNELTSSKCDKKLNGCSSSKVLKPARMTRANRNSTAKKSQRKKQVLYSAVSDLPDRSKHITLQPPGRPVHSDTNLTSVGSIPRCNIRHGDYLLTFPPMSIARYSFTQLSEHVFKITKCPSFETAVKGIRTRALSIESPAFYR